jgi:hypothetical protein
MASSPSRFNLLFAHDLSENRYTLFRIMRQPAAPGPHQAARLKSFGQSPILPNRVQE